MTNECVVFSRGSVNAASLWCVFCFFFLHHSDILRKHLGGFNGRIKLFSRDYLPLELHLCVSVCVRVCVHVNKSALLLFNYSNIFQKLDEGLSEIMKLFSEDFFLPTISPPLPRIRYRLDF